MKRAKFWADEPGFLVEILAERRCSGFCSIAGPSSWLQDRSQEKKLELPGQWVLHANKRISLDGALARLNKPKVQRILNLMALFMDPGNDLETGAAALKILIKAVGRKHDKAVLIDLDFSVAAAEKATSSIKETCCAAFATEDSDEEDISMIPPTDEAEGRELRLVIEQSRMFQA